MNLLGEKPGLVGICGRLMDYMYSVRMREGALTLMEVENKTPGALPLIRMGESHGDMCFQRQDPRRSPNNLIPGRKKIYREM